MGEKLPSEFFDLVKTHLKWLQTLGLSGNQLILENINLERMDFSDCNLSEARFAGSNLTKSNFQKAELYSANFASAQVCHVNFAGANLIKANLDYADLTNANMKNVNAFHASFFQADLQGADLSGSDLRYAYFAEGNLENTVISDAKVTDGTLRGAKGLDKLIVSQIILHTEGSEVHLQNKELIEWLRQIAES